ncbi:MAG: type I restriction endonuclease subunit R [Gudongella sp.]|nr:type I restriction endonuclease subunit R [Gudongella sp.]
MAGLGNEFTLVEKAALDYLVDILGYTYIEASKLTPSFGERESFRDVILINRLRTVIKRLNPWINDESLGTALKFLVNSESLGTSLLEINERIYKAIVDLDFTVSQSIDGQKKPQTVRFIDFDNIDNNEFIVTNQYQVQGINATIYPDIVLFINGIPLVVIEAKSPFKEGGLFIKAGKKDAFDQLQRYMDIREGAIFEGAERLFHTNFILGIINKYHAYCGTISSTYDYFLEWKDPYPFKKEEIEDIENNGQNLFFQGVLEKNNLLKIMQFFILFETDGDRRIKKLARYQQFRACIKAFKRIQEGKTPLERGGVIWHTQGSGKSLSMVMLARMIRRTPSLRDTMLVVITDRVDLDKQIYSTFSRVFPSEYTLAENNLDKILTRAESVEEMKTLLSGGQAKIICTTIQKFQCESDNQAILSDEKTELKLFFDKEIEVLTNKSNVIVFTDEAHRSQYSNLSMNMRKTLPNATFIGFTGTPIEKDDKSTYRTFGQLIDSYTISQAVADGNTVAIIYEGRRQDLHIIQDELDEDFHKYFDNKSDDEKEAIKLRYFNKIALAEAEDRVDDIAKDILIHYRDNSYKLGFKAQVVCVSRHACVKYYDAFIKHMADVFGDNPIEIKVVYSADNNDLPYIKEHRSSKGEQDTILSRFKREIEKDRLCILIVKDMLLTGFDAKIEDVMYLDRPLKEHTLLQAIARVNRTYDKPYKVVEDGEEIEKSRTKAYGRVVDYFGITRHLEEALKVFDNADIQEPMASIDSLFNKMLDYKEAVMRIFAGVDKRDLDALMNVLKAENKRVEFDMAYRRFAIALNALMPTHVRKMDLDDLKWLSYIRAAAKVRFEPENAIDISDCGEKAKELISEHLKSNGVYQWIQPVTLFDNDFSDKINHGSDEAIASTMEHAIKHAINVKMKDNPVHYQSLFERLQKILEETNMNWEERRKQLKEFVEREFKNSEADLTKELGFKEKRQLAIFEMIKAEIQNKKVADGHIYYAGDDENTVFKDITYAVIETIKDNWVVGFTQNPTRINEMEQAIHSKLLLNYYDDIGDYDKIGKLTSRIIELAKIHYYKNDWSNKK